VRFVAQQLAEIKGLPIEDIAQATSLNFENLFPRAISARAGPRELKEER
jgi:TatD DNase family protein